MIALLFLKVNIKEDLKSLISSYSTSSRIMLDLKNDLESQQAAMFKELKYQFRLLFLLMRKLLLILSPAVIVILYSTFTKTPIWYFFDLISFIISIVAFLMVYLFKKYGKPQ
jgi:hypothetical protein